MPAKMFCPKCGQTQRSANHLCQPNALAKVAKAQARAAANAPARK